jgi:TonB-dependent SusC/RagA subfamily outer membrane receptor
MWKKVLLLIAAVLYMNSLSAQRPGKRIEITGTVLDVYHSPIANALIMVDDKRTNSLTDSKGNFRIKVKPTASKIGIFTFGNGVSEEQILGRTRINFNFSTIANQPSVLKSIDGEQGVSTGYGTVKKKNLTTDVNMIDGSDKKYSTYSSISEMIMREVSGVRITGGDIIIQDSQNLYGYIPPLIVVDGVYMNSLPDIPPISVRSIEVLKGTSAAIYGSRGFGGAIIIKTKMQND